MSTAAAPGAGDAAARGGNPDAGRAPPCDKPGCVLKRTEHAKYKALVGKLKAQRVEAGNVVKLYKAAKSQAEALAVELLGARENNAALVEQLSRAAQAHEAERHQVQLQLEHQMQARAPLRAKVEGLEKDAAERTQVHQQLLAALEAKVASGVFLTDQLKSKLAVAPTDQRV